MSAIAKGISSMFGGTPETKAAPTPASALPSIEQTAHLIKTRRSIFTKDFSTEKVDRSVVESLLEAANWAPTHGKNEPWRFVVLDQAGLQDFVDITKEAVNELPDFSPDAREKVTAKLESKKKKNKNVQWALVICFKRYGGSSVQPEWEELAATATAVQNIHLMVTAHNLAGYWTSWGPEAARDSSRVKKWLGLEDEDRCIGAFLLGSSERGDSYRASRGPWQNKVTWKTSEAKV